VTASPEPLLRTILRRSLVRIAGGALSSAPVRPLLARRARRAWIESRRIVFLCHGNVCRSPFAEALARREAGPGRVVRSAGCLGETGRYAPPVAVRAARAWGVDLSGHRSRALDAALDPVAAVFVFDLKNAWLLVRAEPRALRRIHFVASLAAAGSVTIADPWGGSPERFRATYERIAASIPRASAATTAC